MISVFFPQLREYSLAMEQKSFSLMALDKIQRGAVLHQS